MQLLLYLSRAIEERVAECGRPFLAPNKRLDTQNVLYFLLFTIIYGFWSQKNPFSILMPPPVRKDLRHQLTCTWLQEFSRLVNPDWLIQCQARRLYEKMANHKKQRQSTEPIKTQTQGTTWCKSSLLCAYYVLTFKRGKTCAGKRQRSLYRTKSNANYSRYPSDNHPMLISEIHVMFSWHRQIKVSADHYHVTILRAQF